MIPSTFGISKRISATGVSALTVAERIAADMQKIKVGPSGLRITASQGLSGFPGRSVNTSEQLERTAAEVLFRAKSEGRNKISLFRATDFAWVGGGDPISMRVSAR